MDHQLIRQQLPKLVAGHVPSNARNFKFVIFDGEPKVSTPSRSRAKSLPGRTRPLSSRPGAPSSWCSTGRS